MFEKFLSANQGDFRTRYQGTYGFFRNEDAKPILARLSIVDGYVGWTDRRGQTYELYADRPGNIGFEFLPPKSGWFNTDEGAVYVQRAAARQFQRGVTDRNTSLHLLGLKEYGAGMKTLTVNFKNLELVYDATLTPKDAFILFVKEALPSFALSAQFAMDRNRIYVFGTSCGKVLEVKEGSVKITLDDTALFRTEITDALRGICKVEVVEK